jgi:hypothetical protein
MDVEVYVIITHQIDSENPDEVEVYTNGDIALSDAASMARKRMECFDANKQGNGDYPLYEKLCGLIQGKKYAEALQTYYKWMADYQKPDDQVYYYVVSTFLIGPPLTTMEQEVPCKGCKRKVKPSEAICWCCGIDNPGK